MDEVRKMGRQRLKFGYFLISVFSLLFITAAKTFSHETNLPPLEPFARLAINALYLNLAASFFLLVQEDAIITKWRWFSYFLAASLLCVMHPVFSGDMMEYLVRGRLLGLYHVSPYRHLPAEFPGDILFPYSTWKNNPDSYGPVWVYLETLPALVFPNSVTGMIWLEKMILLTTGVLAIYYFNRIIRQSGFSRRNQLLALFAFNPLLLISTVIDGHNDTAMLAFTLVSVYFLRNRCFSRVFFFWTLAFLIKYTVLLVLPFLIVIAVKEEWKRRESFPFLFIARELTVNTLCIIFFFAPLWGGKDTFLALIRASEWFYTNTIPYAMYQGLMTIGFHVQPVLLKSFFLLTYLLVYLFILFLFCREERMDPRRFFRLFALIYLCFYPTITIPFGLHYLLWALPWIILAQWPLSEFLVTLYAFTGLFSYFKRINYLLLIAAALYALALLFWRWQTPSVSLDKRG